MCDGEFPDRGDVRTVGTKLPVEFLTGESFEYWGWACGMLLARAHSQSANASILRGYVGTSDAVHNAVAEWSYAYADKSLDDFHQLRAAAKAGEIQVADDPVR